MDEQASGKYYLVKCIGTTNLVPQPCKEDRVVVKIVDYCPIGCRGTINLSDQHAFSAIADPNAGRIKIEYYL
ncbi:hypothetical protein FH972_012911 [Carpinus fangiana]|uniref:RlpA-like protein double-psi beta-barrel domain-containing protein n=1 Tax=Carpinus fangiana TaxID=176857 RepID=A0A5N6R5F3_9ROSI|nr:hypothetical protein FH972_012911 [Carpinus fangiana]